MVNKAVVDDRENNEALQQLLHDLNEIPQPQTNNAPQENLSTAGTELTSNLTLRYALALSLIAVLSIATYLAIHFVIDQQSSDAPVINLSGRQRMLSQKLTKEALLLTQPLTKERRAQTRLLLTETLTTWSRVHKGLQHGDKELELPGNNSSQVQRLFEKINPHYQVLSDTTAQLLQQDNDRLSFSLPEVASLVETIVATSPLYLQWMDEAVFQYQAEAQQRVNALKQYEAAIVASMLLILVLEALFIFRPMVRRVHAHSRQLVQQNQELTAAAAKREQLEGQLRHAHKMDALGTLAGGVAHEFNNVMGIIRGNADLLQSLLRDQRMDKASAYIDRIVSATRRAANITGQILTFSRKEITKFTELNPGLIVQEVLAMLTAIMPGTIAIKQDFEAHDVRVMADSTQLYQAILNLCTNALDAMAERGGVLSVTIRTNYCTTCARHDCRFSADHPKWCLVVSDSGCGIPAAHLDKIFDPFFTTKEVGKGTGLGLGVVHGIVQNHRGQIHVESALGIGTTFRLCLPLITTESLINSD